jgi:hypothetical protein
MRSSSFLNIGTPKRVHFSVRRPKVREVARVLVPHKHQPPIAERGNAYLVGPAPITERLFGHILRREGYSGLYPTASLSVTQLAEAAPTFLLIDFRDLDLDQLETLRQIRFVLPRSIIAVYSEDSSTAWAYECHLAGANCMLAKGSRGRAMASGIHRAIQGGCYTDPHFGVIRTRMS